MNIEDTLDTIWPMLEKLDKESLTKVLDSLEKIIEKTKEIREIMEAPEKNNNDYQEKEEEEDESLDDIITSVTDLHLETLDIVKYLQLEAYVKELHYTPQGVNQPSLYLFGDSKYVYNKVTAELTPTPLDSSDIMSSLVAEVNAKFNCNFNSVLVNKYHNLNSHLKWHKDDEKKLDPSSPIAILSIGATRRLQISTNDNKEKCIHEVHLTPNSTLVTLPEFQTKFHHQLAKGLRSKKKEKGERYSVTFRRIIEPMVESSTPRPAPYLDTLSKQPQPKDTKIDKSKTEPERYDAVVFGSSLVKGLDESLLSNRDRKSFKFKVYPHPGAHVRDITTDIKTFHEKGMLSYSENVTSVFLVCGGNDIENLHHNQGLHPLFEDYKALFKCTKDIFPNAKINVISLIPRRTRYGIPHVHRMYDVNDWLRDHCAALCSK